MEETLTTAGKVIAVAILFVVGFALNRWTYRNVHGYRHLTDKKERKSSHRNKRLRLFKRIGKQVTK